MSKYHRIFTAVFAAALALGSGVFGCGPQLSQDREESSPLEPTAAMSSAVSTGTSLTYFPLMGGSIVAIPLCGGTAEPCCNDGQCHTGVCNTTTQLCEGADSTHHLVRRIDRTIPIHFIEVHATTAPRYHENDVYHAMAASASKVYRRAGLQFYLGEVKSVIAPVLGGSNTAEVPWATVSSELTGLFTITDIPPDKIKDADGNEIDNIATPCTWATVVSTVYSDKDEVIVWVFETGAAIGKGVKTSNGWAPMDGSMIVINQASLGTTPGFFSHELGHYLGLRHPNELAIGGHRLPNTTDKAQWYDFWDLMYCPSEHSWPPTAATFFTSRAQALSDSSCAAEPRQAASCTINGDAVGDSPTMECTIQAVTYHSDPSPTAVLHGLSIFTGVQDNVPFAFRYGFNTMSLAGSLDIPHTRHTRLISQSQADIVARYINEGSVRLVEETYEKAIVDHLGLDHPHYTNRGLLGSGSSALRGVGGTATAIAAGIEGNVHIIESSNGYPTRYDYAPSVDDWVQDSSQVGTEIAVNGHEETWIISGSTLKSRADDNAPWVLRPGCARDIAGSIGSAITEDRGTGSLWHLGCHDGLPYKWNEMDTSWAVKGAIVGDRIGVAGINDVWIVEANTGSIFRLVAGLWVRQPGEARDIAGGADGSVWMLGKDTGYAYIWDADRWVLQSELFGNRIAVDGWGAPWVVGTDSNVYGLYR